MLNNWKMRVWNQKTKTMSYCRTEDLFIFGSPSAYNDIVILPWTGLMTSYGEPIYEGDILINPYDDEDSPFFVEFKYGAFYATSVYGDEITLLSELCDLEIRSNVYENSQIFEKRVKIGG